SIQIQAGQRITQKLFPFLSARCTNRRPYSLQPLEPSARKTLNEVVRESGGELSLLEDHAKKKLAAKAICANDRILFEQPDLHHYLFSSIRWSEEEAQKTRDGLYIKTFELGPLGAGFRMLKSWSFTRLIHAIGLDRFLPTLSY